MRLQLLGPMTGLPECNYPAFNEAAARLRATGHTVWNPAESDNGRRGRSWAWYMRQSLQALLHADIAVLLPGWEHSRGAQLEVTTALRLGLPVIPLEAFISLAIDP